MNRARALPLTISLFLAAPLACDSSLEEDAGLSPDARADASLVRDLGSPNDAGRDLGIDAGIDAEVDGGGELDAESVDLGSVDAQPFPIKVAYAAAAEDPLVLELYLTDTSTSRARVNGPMAGGPAGGVKEPETGGLQSFEWSSDGQRLLYQAQQETYDVSELYVAAAGGTRPGPWRKLSLPGTTEYVQEIRPSHVSPRVAFSQYENNRTNLYVVSSTATDPVVRQISQGFAFQHQWSPTADELAYHDIIQSMNDRDLWFAQAYPGAPPAERVNAGANLGFGGALAWAPDGSSFVYTADERALRLFELYRVTVTNGLLGTRERLHPAFGANSDIGFDQQVAAAFSPDATKVAYVADPRIANLDELFIIDLEGGAPSLPVTLSSTAAATDFVYRFSFDPSGALVLYATRSMAAGPEGLFLVDVDRQSSPVPLLPPGNRGSFLDDAWARDGELLVFRHYDGQKGALYAIDLLGSRTPIRLDHVPADQDPGLNTWSLSPDGRRLFYVNREEAGTYTLHTLSLEDLSAPSPQLLSRGASYPAWCIPPNTNTALALAADLEVSGQPELYWVENVEAPTFIKVSGPLVSGGRVSGCAFAP